MENQLATIGNNPPAVSMGTGVGFECMDSNDLIASRISIVQPTSQTEIAPGTWYDNNTNQPYGKDLLFFVLSKKTVFFKTIDDKTGEEKMIERKEVLVMPEDLDFPIIISLSRTGYWPLSNMMTRLYKSFGKKQLPIFSGLIKATTELVMTEKKGIPVKYYIPKFEAVRKATEQELSNLTAYYNEIVPLFRGEKITGAEFDEPISTDEKLKEIMPKELPQDFPMEAVKNNPVVLDNVAETLGITKEEIEQKKDGVGLNKVNISDPFSDLDSTLKDFNL